MVSPLGEVVDEMAFVHNLVGKTGVHSQATYLQATGFQLPGFPGMGAWVSYGLGSMNDNLPTFVVLPDHRGFASNGPKNWHAAFLPAQHQGTIIRPGVANPIADLFPPDGKVTAARETATGSPCSSSSTANTRRSARTIRGSRHASVPTNSQRRCSSPRRRRSTSRRSRKHILKMYGLDHGVSSGRRRSTRSEEVDYMGRKCLIARRLLERGVRFVQIWSGCDNGFPRRNWDSHEDIERDHGPLATGLGVGAAALIKDLKQRGMLEDTIVLWTTEFGRMPSTQGSKGRDHNPFVFTNWLAGGGIRAAPRTGRATSGGTSRSTAQTRPRSTTSTRRSCTCSASTTSNSPSATTASTGG